MERQNERISKLKADVFPSGAGDESEACKISNAKQQGRIGRAQRVTLFKNKWSPC